LELCVELTWSFAPDGERAIASLHAGDLVFSVDRDAIVVVQLLKVEHTAVAHHRFVRVELEDGRVLEICPGTRPRTGGRSATFLPAVSSISCTQCWLPSSFLILSSHVRHPAGVEHRNVFRCWCVDWQHAVRALKEQLRSHASQATAAADPRNVQLR